MANHRIFHFFSISVICIIQCQIILEFQFHSKIELNWCPWNLNPGPQDGRRRWIHRALGTGTPFRSPKLEETAQKRGKSPKSGDIALICFKSCFLFQELKFESLNFSSWNRKQLLKQINAKSPLLVDFPLFWAVSFTFGLLSPRTGGSHCLSLMSPSMRFNA